MISAPSSHPSALGLAGLRRAACFAPTIRLTSVTRSAGSVGAGRRTRPVRPAPTAMQRMRDHFQRPGASAEHPMRRAGHPALDGWPRGAEVAQHEIWSCPSVSTSPSGPPAGSRVAARHVTRPRGPVGAFTRVPPEQHFISCSAFRHAGWLRMRLRDIPARTCWLLHAKPGHATPVLDTSTSQASCAMNIRTALPAVRTLAVRMSPRQLHRRAPCATAHVAWTHALGASPRAVRTLTTSLPARSDAEATATTRAAPGPAEPARRDVAFAKELDGYGPPVAVYKGIMAPALRRLKFFSLASLGLATSMSPVLLFAPDVDISAFGRSSMVVVTLLASIGSTAAITAFSKPYVGEMRLYTPTDAAAAAGKSPLIQMDTSDIFLRSLTTTVYDPSWLGPGAIKPLASWALAKRADHAPPLTDHELQPIKGAPVKAEENERLVAETVFTRTGKPVGRVWGTLQPALNLWKMRKEGKPVWQYQVHDHLLGEEWQIL